jgi:hypothetical protein
MQSSSQQNFAQIILQITLALTFFRQEKLPNGMVRVLHR